eukprot:jgi/Ulvmu1/2835/UM143_0007.1
MDSKQLGCAAQQDGFCTFNQILTGYTNLHSKLYEIFRSSDGQVILPRQGTSQTTDPVLQCLVRDSNQLTAIATDVGTTRNMNTCQRQSLAMLATVASYAVLMMSERPHLSLDDASGWPDVRGMLFQLAWHFGVGPQQRQHLWTTSGLCAELEADERRAAAHAIGTACDPPLGVLVIWHALRLLGHTCSTAWAAPQHGSTEGPSIAAGPASFIRASQPPACTKARGTPPPGLAPCPNHKQRSCHDLRTLIDDDLRQNMSSGVFAQAPPRHPARPAATALRDAYACAPLRAAATTPEAAVHGASHASHGATRAPAAAAPPGALRRSPPRRTLSAAAAAIAVPRRVNMPTPMKTGTPTRAPAFGSTPVAATRTHVSTPAGPDTLQAPSACGHASPTYTVPNLNPVSANPVDRTLLDWGSPQRAGSVPLGTIGSARSVATCMGAPGAHLTAVADLHSAGGITPTGSGDGMMQGPPAMAALKKNSPVSGYHAHEGLQKTGGHADTMIQHPGTSMPTLMPALTHIGIHMAAGAQPHDGCKAAAGPAAAPTDTDPMTGKRSREEALTDAETGRSVRARCAELPLSMLCALPPQQRAHVARREASPHSQDWQSAGAWDNAPEEEDDYCLPSAHSLSSLVEFSADMECFDNVWDESGDAFGDALAEIEGDATEEEEEDFCLRSVLSFSSLAEFTADMDSFDGVWDEAGDALAEIEAVVQQSCCANDAMCADVLLTAELIDGGGR